MAWRTPGDYKGYMAVTLGNFESALVQMSDGERRRSAGEFLRDECFAPLGIEDEIYVGTPASVPDARFAVIDGMSGLEPLFADSFPPGFVRRLLLEPRSYTARAFANPRLSALPSVLDYNRREVKEIELPAANGNATARAVATLYAAAERAINDPALASCALARRARALGLSAAALAEFTAPARPARLGGWHDEILGIDVTMSAGMMKPGPPDAPPGRFSNFGADGRAFGTPGAGGSFGFCDPAAELGYCYVPNRCSGYILDDPREMALRTKVWRCAQRAGGYSGARALPLARLSVPHELAARDVARFPYLAPLP